MTAAPGPAGKGVGAAVRALLARMKSIDESPGTFVGILSEGKAKQPHPKAEGLTMAQLGAIHEFGLGVPERSFLRSFRDQRADDIGKVFLLLVQRRGVSQAVWELLGQWCVGEIQKRIAAGTPPPNAPSTIARKGSSTPLIDTGQLRSSITYAVRKVQR